MQEYLLNHAVAIHASAFCGSLIIVSFWEGEAPQRHFVGSLWVRWANNFAVYFLNIVVIRFIVPVTGITLAIMVAEKGWGLFNVVSTAEWLATICSLLALDLLHYLKHILLHKIPVLWRCHRMHHTDHDFDLTTGIRFHPLEALLSAIVTMGIIVALGVSVTVG